MLVIRGAVKFFFLIEVNVNSELELLVQNEVSMGELLCRTHAS